MKKSLLSVILIIVLSTMVIFSAYFFLFNTPKKNIDIFQNIPGKPAMIIEVRNFHKLWKKLNDQNIIWQEIIVSKQVISKAAKISYWDSLLYVDDNTNHLLKEKPSFLTVYPDGGLLFILSHNMSSKNLLHFFTKNLEPTQRVTKLKHEEYLIYSVQGKTNYDLSITSDVIAISNSKDLIRDFLFNIEGGKNDIPKKFEAMRSLAGKRAEASIFISYADFILFFSKYIIPDKRSFYVPPEFFASYSVLDLNVRPDRFLMSGFAITPDTVSYAERLFESIPTANLSVASIIPHNAILLIRLSINTLEDYLDKRNFFCNIDGLDAYCLNHVKSIDSVFSNKLSERVFPALGKEMAFFISNNNTQGMAFYIKNEEEKEAIFKVFDTNTVEKELFLSYHLHLLDNDWFSVMFPFIGRKSEKAYATIINNYLIISEDNNELKKLISQILNEQTLAHSRAFEKFSKNLIHQDHIFIYRNLHESWSNIQELLVDSSTDFINDNIGKIRNISDFALQYSFQDGKLFTNACFSYDDSRNNSITYAWQYNNKPGRINKVSSIPGQSPYGCFFVATDTAKNLLFFSREGKLLWRRKIDRPVVGGFSPVDFYNNGKYQIIFNTVDSLYIIDRLGRDVENYPVLLNRRAASGHTLLKYDQKTAYRILIPMMDSSILNLNKFGKPVRGWRFSKSKSLITKPVKHFVWNKRDYIVCVDVKGNGYFLNRRGENRFSQLPLNHEEYNSEIYLKRNSKGHPEGFISYNKKGIVLLIDANGETTELFQPKDMSEYVIFQYIWFEEVKKELFAFADGNSLFFYNEDFECIFTQEFKNDRFIEIVEPIKSYFGIITDKTKRIFLYNPKLELVEGFPAQGNAFALGKCTGKSAIIAIDNKLYLFLLD